MKIHHRLGRLACDRRLVRVPGDEPAVDLPPVRLKTAADVLSLLGQQIDAVLNDRGAGPLEKARLVGYLAGLGLKAIETGNLEGRIEMLEAVLKQRQEKGER
jgi:hypothetical protein